MKKYFKAPFTRRDVRIIMQVLPMTLLGVVFFIVIGIPLKILTLGAFQIAEFMDDYFPIRYIE